MALLLFPRFRDKESLIDELTRSIWYFEPLRENTKILYILYGGTDFSQHDLDAMLSDFQSFMAEHFDPVLPSWALLWKGKIQLIHDPDGEKEKTWSTETSGILAWGERTPDNIEMMKGIGDRTGIFYTWANIDKTIGEAANRNLFTYRLCKKSENELYRKQAEHSIKALSKEIDNRKIYVYGSAPSVSQLVDAQYDFGDAVHIVCNSLVKNTELMDMLKPKIVVCADPVFHIGPSRYAAEFRRTLNEFMGRHDSYLVTIDDYAPNLKSSLDEKFHDRIIGLSMRFDGDVNVNLMEDPVIRTSENILTLLLLPLAFTFSTQVSILGCDGRSFVQDDYFWTHDKKSQFGDLMDEAKKVHPAFFVRDFNKYYIYHCETLEEVLQEGEKNGCRVQMITPTYIPPLAKRYRAVI